MRLLLTLVLTLAACSGPAPVAPTPEAAPGAPALGTTLARSLAPAPDAPRAECLAGDCLTGTGTLRVVAGGMFVTYEGPFADGVPHGEGVASSAEGDTLRGPYDHGRATGRVAIAWADGTTSALGLDGGQLGLRTTLDLDHPDQPVQRLTVADQEYGVRTNRIRRLANVLGPRIEGAIDTRDRALLEALLAHLDQDDALDSHLLDRLMTDTDALRVYLDAGGNPTAWRLLTRVALAAVTDGDEVPERLRLLIDAAEPGTPGLADRLRLPLDRAANACRPTLTRLLLDAGGDPNGCIEREGRCVSSTGTGQGTRPYFRALDKLGTLTEADPAYTACDATVELLQPLTPYR